MQRPAVERTGHPTLAAEHRPARPTDGPPERGPVAALHAASTPAPAPNMQDVLEAATPALRRCSALADGLLIVDFTTVQGRDAFAVR
jgi:hypothetical protein